MPILNIKEERDIVQRGLAEGKSPEFIKSAVLRFRERAPKKAYGEDPQFKASIGGAGTIVPNIAKTIGNIPSSAVHLADTAFSPPLNLLKSVIPSRRPEDAGKFALGEIFQGGVKEGTKALAGGFGSTAKKIFQFAGDLAVQNRDKKDLLDSLSPIQEQTIKQQEVILQKIQEAKKEGRNTTNLVKALKYNQESLDSLNNEIGTKEERRNKEIQTFTNIAKYGIERPLEIPLALETGGPKSNISRIASPVTRGVETNLSGIVRNLTTKSEQQIESIIVKKFEKGVKPLLGNKTTPAKLQDYREDILDGVQTIKENKSNLSFNDNAGEVIVGQNPKSLQQFSDAIEQTKKTIFTKYDALAKEAGEAGVRVEMSPIASELDLVINNKALALTNPEAIRYAKETQIRYGKAGKLDAVTAQEVVQNYNKSLEAFYRNPTYDNASQAAIDAILANRVRQALDEGISGLTGSQYKVLKKQYGSLKTIERDVIKATLRDARKNTKGLIDFTDIFSGGQVVNGILSLNPATIAQGLTAKAIAEFYKYLNNPNRAIEKMFNLTEKLPQRLIQSSKSGKSLLQIQPKTNIPTTPKINIINKNVTQTNRKVLPPVKSQPIKSGKSLSNDDIISKSKSQVSNPQLKKAELSVNKNLYDEVNPKTLTSEQSNLQAEFIAVAKDFADGKIGRSEVDSLIKQIKKLFDNTLKKKQ